MNPHLKTLKPLSTPEIRDAPYYTCAGEKQSGSCLHQVPHPTRQERVLERIMQLRLRQFDPLITSLERNRHTRKGKAFRIRFSLPQAQSMLARHNACQAMHVAYLREAKSYPVRPRGVVGFGL